MGYARVWDLNHDHCTTWASAMNWGHVRRLDLSSGSPTHLLDALSGRVPQLKDLTFGFWPNETSYPTSAWSCADDPDVLIRFLNSIVAPERVRLYSWDGKDMRQIRLVLLARYGPTLRHLESDLGSRDAWNIEQFADVCNRAPDLEGLKATMGLEKVDGKGDTMWSNGTQRLLTRIQSLRHLTLQIVPLGDSRQIIDYCPGSFGDVDSVKLTKGIARNLVRKMWHDFGPGSAIERIEMSFVAPYSSTRIWTFRATMKWENEHGEERLQIDSTARGPYYGA